MILSDATLKKMLKTGKLVVEPLQKNSIQPASVDCHLDDHFLVIEPRTTKHITLDSPTRYREIHASSIVIKPHSFLLATTREYIELPANISAFVEGRSSIGRIGLFIQNAGWVDPGFKGTITLELYNANSVPITLESGRRICQLVFAKMDQAAKNPYKGKYQGQRKTTGSRIAQDTEVKTKKKRA